MRRLVTVFAYKPDFSSVLMSLFGEKDFDLYVLYDGRDIISENSMRLLEGLKELKSDVQIIWGNAEGIAKARAKALDIFRKGKWEQMVMLDDDIFWNGDIFSQINLKIGVWGVVTTQPLKCQYRHKRLSVEYKSPIGMNEEQMNHTVVGEVPMLASETLFVVISKKANINDAYNALSKIGNAPKEDLILTLLLGKGQKLNGMVFHLQTNSTGKEWLGKLDDKIWENVTNKKMALQLGEILK